MRIWIGRSIMGVAVVHTGFGIAGGPVVGMFMRQHRMAADAADGA